MFNNSVQECDCPGICLGHKFVKTKHKNPKDTLEALKKALLAKGCSVDMVRMKADGSFTLTATFPEDKHA